MRKTITVIAATALIAAQASAAFAATKDNAPVAKAAPVSCAPLKATKTAQKARVENRCDSDDHSFYGVSPAAAVFGAAAVAGVIAIAVTTTNNNSSTSP